MSKVFIDVEYFEVLLHIANVGNLYRLVQVSGLKFIRSAYGAQAFSLEYVREAT